MGDSVSLPTNVVHSDTVSRIQQGQQTNQQAEEKFAKKLREQSDDDTSLLKNIEDVEKAKLERRKKRDEDRKERGEDEPNKGPDIEGRGGKVDLKA